MNNLHYGIIGNCKSAALISKEGSIDWCCLPEFDSSSVFAKLLDTSIGGSFEILVDDSYTITQSYYKFTNILITKFSSEEGVFEVHDFMPRFHEASTSSYYAPPDIIRYVSYISGKPKFSVKYDAKLRYAKGKTETMIKPGFIASINQEEKYDSIYLYTSVHHDSVLSSEKIELTQDEFFMVSYNEKILDQTTEKAFFKLEKTKVYWLTWVENTPKYKKYNDQIIRSALTLKLLSYDKTGAILAAATTSLPETIGEVRNWDYRFCWIRDASMTIKVVSDLGHEDMARRFMQYVIDLVPDKDEKLQIMYGINKEKTLTEETLDHLSGYENSAPVRIGNAAYMQRQNDIYGILMDAIHQQIYKFETTVENCEELWGITKGIVLQVKEHWKEADKGIWEFRTEERHFTFSKMLCWVAIDRAIKTAKILNKPRYIERWVPLEQEIKNDIFTNAWSDEKQAFVQSYGSQDLDTSVLLMETYGIIEARDERYVKTVQAIEKELCNDGLLYRYKNQDDFGLPSSSFTICSFWFINSLNKIGEHTKAREMFDRLLSYSNHLGLFSEDIDFKTKRLLGNFPQAYSHLALIETAANLANTFTDEHKVKTAIH
ncbi:Glucoamylase (glucan-1,4-alpha-glucosidase), GH15 family [Pustulibacterium marinum]|uniref:Glucoamylase (Glucan-1,4-alpha-glucosidase), GH15 family n=1 Tax=Pustulibacterium marinum TaxID=1224947 RepID=A0A1I7HWF1_9FLAO|nr:glycoside hydrolase family 15 protein [Pustulibacterium marinum]SFU65028.1 Glucoamylase (glucan-1,4-alpha-glucosidase), GH15 family [Pustulibacterium marinum]